MTLSQSTTLVTDTPGRIHIQDLIAFVARVAVTPAAILGAQPWVDIDTAGLGYETESPSTERRL